MTDEDRREVAERLRERPVARNIKEAYVSIVQAVGVRPCLLSHEGESGDRFDAAAYADALDNLADLIDPTCNFEESADNDDFSIRVVFGYICHDCGHETIVESTAGGWAEPPHYCSNCGARLVSDDD